MKYDYFAFVLERHQQKIKDVLDRAKDNKYIKLQNSIEVIEKRPRQRPNNIEKLSELANEPIKTHLVFDKLKEGKDSSWKNILTEFYNRKVSDLNNDLSRALLSIFKKNYNISLGNIISLKITLTSPFFTASENKFYSIQNPIAKERPTGLPLLKGSSLKGALRQAAVDEVENELLENNYRDKLNDYLNKTDEEIEKIETNKDDKFFFKKRAQLVKLFGNEKDITWFTFRSLLATGGIKKVNDIKDILKKISKAFENYLKAKNIVNSEGLCKGRLIFEDLHFKKVTLDVITPLNKEKRTPILGPIFYEVVPEREIVKGTLVWFPFDLIAKREFEKIESEWDKDKEVIEKAFKRLSEKGIGAKTKDGWGRFKWEKI